MQVFTVLGSARKEGNTAKVLGWVEDELRALGHSVDRADAYDFHIKSCTGCNTCKLDLDTPGCILEDDCDGLQQRMLDAEALVVASPLYGWSYTAQAKAFLERGYAFAKPQPGGGMRSLAAGRRIAFIITAGGGIENNIDLLTATFPRLINWHGLINPANLLVPGCTRPADIPASVRDEARQLAARLTAG
jgi:multimeric flavodoxin WrbA